MPMKEIQRVKSLIINQFGGVDFSTDPSKVSMHRSPNSLNMIANENNFPVKRTGYEKIGLNGTVFGLHRYVTADNNQVLLVHCGERMYQYDQSAGTFILVKKDLVNDAVVASNQSVSFMMDMKQGNKNVLWILDGTTYQYYDGLYLRPVSCLDSNSLSDVKVYIPTTLYGAYPDGSKPEGSVSVDEPVNYLTGWQKNRFIADVGIHREDVLEIWSKPTTTSNVSGQIMGVFFNVSVNNTMTVDQVSQTIVNAVNNENVSYVKTKQDDRVVIKFSDKKIGTYNNPLPVIDFKNSGVEGTVYNLSVGVKGKYEFHTSGGSIDEQSQVMVKINDVEIPQAGSKPYTVDYAKGIVKFIEADANGVYNAPAPVIGGVPNVEITFRKTISGYADAINRCTIANVYGGNIDTRVFLSGNPDLPNSDFQSGLYDPTYFGDTSYTKIGSDRSRIMGYHKIVDSQMIIKSDNEQDATHYLRTYQLDSSNTPIFPLTQGKDSYGAVAKRSFATLGDVPLYLSKDGVIGIFSTSVKQQASMKNVSVFVNNRLTKERNIENATGYAFGDKYYLCINDNVYVADGKQFNNGQFEWYYWNNIGATVLIEFCDALYFGKADGLYRFYNNDEENPYNDASEPIDAYWTTPFTTFEQWDRLKNIERISTVIMPYTHTGVKQSYRTNHVHLHTFNEKHADLFDFNDIDFSRFSFATIQAPTPICKKIKVKKCLTFQLKIQNDWGNEPFGLLAVAIDYRIGNQIK